MALGSGIVFCLIFSTQIVAFVQARNLVGEQPNVAVVPNEPLTLETSDTPDTFIDFHSITIPEVIPKSDRRSDNDYFAFVDEEQTTRYYLVAKNTSHADIFKNTPACEPNLDAHTFCTSNYQAVQTILATEPRDANILSSKDNAILTSLKLQLKSDILFNQTRIVPFTNSFGIQGFILASESVTTVLLFDTEDNQYEMAFSQFTTDDIHAILSNIQSSLVQ
jgi:hypothetical protein